MTDSYISIDLETTGLDPKRDRIIEIGAVKVRDGNICDRYQKLVDPRRELGEFVSELTGISDDMLQGMPVIQDLIGEVVEWCEELPLLGHHIIFDYSFLKRAAVNAGLTFERCGIDTLALCRLYMPAEEKKNLAAASAYYEIEQPEAHRALADAMTTHLLYQRLAQQESEHPEAFSGKSLIYKVKKEQPASKRQKEHLRDLAKCHRIDLTVQIDDLSRNEISRMIDKIILQFGR